MERWRALIEERLAEAVASLGSTPGVRGLMVGGSVGRGEPWPMSDIDILPIVAAGAEAGEEIARRQAALVDWWAASGRAQTLDVGWLTFTDAEVEEAISSEAGYAAARMADRRWLHGLDKAFGGYGAADEDDLAGAFARWATRVRFEPPVRAARAAAWGRQASEARDGAVEAVKRGEPSTATLRMREAACALRLVLVETWGERLGSMGREWTRFDQMAARHGAADLAARLAEIVAARPEEALERARHAPVWLQERIDRAYQARLAIGEPVSEAESARDQLAAFTVHVTRRQPEPWGEWVAVPDPRLGDKLRALDGLMEQILSQSTPANPSP
jgi:predicted nucleotidyltransferase